MNGTLKRIDRILREVKTARGDRNIPTFKQFLKEWVGMDALSKSVYEAVAECPELLGEPNAYDKAIAGYLKRMGLVTEQHSLTEILDRLGGDAVARS